MRLLNFAKMKETWTWKICFPTVEKIIDQNKTRLRQAIKFVKFCGRHERISKKQNGSLVGRIPSFHGENSQLFIHKLFDFLDYSNHKQFFLFKAFASITSTPPSRKHLAAPLSTSDHDSSLLWFPHLYFLHTKKCVTWASLDTLSR